MRIKSRIKDNRRNVRIRFAGTEELNAREIEFLSKKPMMGFFTIKQLGKRVLEYTGPDCIALAERLKKPLTKSEFFLIMAQISDSVRKVKNNNLYAKNIYLDLKYVFFNEKTKEVLFIYLPIGSSFMGADFLSFMSAIVYSAQPCDNQNPEYISNFAFFIRNLDGFDAGKIDEYIMSEDRSVMNKIRKSEPTFKKAKEFDEISEDDYNSQTGKLAEEDPLEEEGTAILAADESSDYEASNGLETLDKSSARASLLRVLTQEKIALNKPVFRIGKERSYVDYFVSDNNAISRSHADIITRGSRFFIMDLNSKNRSFLNDEPLAPNCEVEMFDGDKIKLANEDFVFQL